MWWTKRILNAKNRRGPIKGPRRFTFSTYLTRVATKTKRGPVMTLINVAIFERRMPSSHILFETFWNKCIPGKYCTGTRLDSHWTSIGVIPTPADVEVFHYLDKLLIQQIGLHLERNATTRKIYIGIVGIPCFDQFEPMTVMSLAEIELHNENTPAFDWLCDSTESQEPSISKTAPM